MAVSALGGSTAPVAAWSFIAAPHGWLVGVKGTVVNNGTDFLQHGPTVDAGFSFQWHTIAR